MTQQRHDDRRTIAALNERSGAGLELLGRATAGKLGGALLVRWPDGRAGVVTVFGGDATAAARVATSLNELAGSGLPVPRHDLVVDLGERVVFVQERLPAPSPRKFSEAQVDAIWAISERFAGAATALSAVPPVRDWFLPVDGPGYDGVARAAAAASSRAEVVVAELVDVATSRLDVLEGTDVVHVDLNAANVLFDADDVATGVVDWNLGLFAGPRHLALVQTRFDREWFVRGEAPDLDETAAAHYLDELLRERVDPERLRAWWAFWLLHGLPKAFAGRDTAVLDWHLDLADTRILRG